MSSMQRFFYVADFFEKPIGLIAEKFGRSTE